MQEKDFSQEAKAIDNRLATVEGHIRAVRKMLSQGKDCIEVITQLMAVERSIKKAGVLVLKSHLNYCVKEAVAKRENAAQSVDELNKILEMYL